MYKKIYLEVTNICNLDCHFCIKNNRKKEYISDENFEKILKKIKPYTKYLYFHLMGEPLMHPRINELINMASKDFNINITTNGFLINKIRDNKNIRQINISLHSYNSKYNISLDDYINNIVNVINNFHNNTYFSLRFWVDNEYTETIINKLEEIYKKEIVLENGFEIIKNVFISIGNEFIWPDINNTINEYTGKCYALRDHVGILVNGDIVPCCLDANGKVVFGNIYKDNIDDIINSKRYQNMLNGFKNNKKVEKLCQKCKFFE